MRLKKLPQKNSKPSPERPIVALANRKLDGFFPILENIAEVIFPRNKGLPLGSGFLLGRGGVAGPYRLFSIYIDPSSHGTDRFYTTPKLTIFV